MVIPYGTARPPGSWMTPSAGGNGFTIRAPYATAVAGRDRALRLHGIPGGSREAAGDDGLASLRAALARHCDPWRRGPLRFLDRYFGFVARHAEAHRAALTAGLERFGGLYGYRDWVYSALAPLPRAHLHAPEGDAPFGPESLIRVDFAFWTGTSAIAIEIPGIATRSPAVERRHERLRRVGTLIVELADDVLDPARAAEFDAALPEDLRLFWRGQALPAGPLKPAALDVEAEEI